MGKWPWGEYVSTTPYPTCVGCGKVKAPQYDGPFTEYESTRGLMRGSTWRETSRGLLCLDCQRKE